MVKPDNKSKSLIHAGWLVDGTGNPLKRDQLIEIDHGVIRSISPIDRQTPPPDIVVDLSHATLLPVLMDAHVHDHIKIINSGINSLEDFGYTSPPHFSENDLEAVAQLARANQLPLMVHANGMLAVRMAITAGCNSLEHGYFMGDDNLLRMAENRITWVPTLAPMAALAQQFIVTARQTDVARKTLEHQMSQIALAIQNDVPIALGTDAGSIGVDHGVSVRQEMALLMGCGMPLVQAVRSATADVARLMQLDERGALLAGYRADLIAVSSPPGELPDSLTCIEAMLINGRWIDLD
jgi:imidazolonepropionase-like amidohydrolase